MLRVACLTLLLLSLALPLCAAYTLPSLIVPRDTQAAVMGDWIVFAAGDMYALAFRPTPVAQDRAISHLLHPSVSWVSMAGGKRQMRCIATPLLSVRDLCVSYVCARYSLPPAGSGAANPPPQHHSPPER